MKCKGLSLNVRCYAYAISLWLHFTYPSRFNADTIVRLIFSAAVLKQIKLFLYQWFALCRGGGGNIFTEKTAVMCFMEMESPVWSPQCTEVNGKAPIYCNTARAVPSMFYVRLYIGYFISITLTKQIVLLIL